MRDSVVMRAGQKRHPHMHMGSPHLHTGTGTPRVHTGIGPKQIAYGDFPFVNGL